MNDLRRELAPVVDAAWKQIELEATRTLKTSLAGRKLVDFDGPHGWDHGAIQLGRAERLQEEPAPGVEVRRRLVQPLLELRVPFELDRDELDSVSRGAEDADLDPVVQASRRLALAEDRALFYGFPSGQIRGLFSSSPHEPLPIGTDFLAFPRVVSDAVEVLREAGIGGPYALALGASCYTGLARTAGPGGYPVIQHVKRLLDGPVIWAPVLDGAVLVSLRGGDYQLVVGRDVSIGYLDHDARRVRLYLEESFTFRVLQPEAAVPLPEQA